MMKTNMTDVLLDGALIMVLGGALIAGFELMPSQEKTDSVIAEYRVDIEKRDGLSLYSNKSTIRIDVVGEIPAEKDLPLPGERVALMLYDKSQAQMCQDNRCMDVDVIITKPAFLRRHHEPGKQSASN